MTTVSFMAVEYCWGLEADLSFAKLPPTRWCPAPDSLPGHSWAVSSQLIGLRPRQHRGQLSLSMARDLGDLPLEETADGLLLHVDACIRCRRLWRYRDIAR